VVVNFLGENSQYAFLIFKFMILGILDRVCEETTVILFYTTVRQFEASRCLISRNHMDSSLKE